MDGLLLHCGGHAASLEAIEAVPTPEPTQSHFPIPHARLVREVRDQLVESGVEIQEEAYALSHDGYRMFGCLALHAIHLPAANGSDLVLGIRNSHDRTFCAGLALGSRVFVCDNLAFYGTRTLARKHTRYAERDLPGLIAKILGQLGEWAERQAQAIASYEATALANAEAHDFMIEAVRVRAVPPSKLGSVIEGWHGNKNEERSLWFLFNAVTESMRGSIEMPELARRTEKLYGLADLRVSRMNGNGRSPARALERSPEAAVCLV